MDLGRSLTNETIVLFSSDTFTPIIVFRKINVSPKLSKERV
jgi:hypothetical protein